MDHLLIMILIHHYSHLYQENPKLVYSDYHMELLNEIINYLLQKNLRNLRSPFLVPFKLRAARSSTRLFSASDKSVKY